MKKTPRYRDVEGKRSAVQEENKDMGSDRKSPRKSPEKGSKSQPSAQEHTLQYKDYLVYIVKKYENEYKKTILTDDNKKSVYTLYEDLRIIQELAKESVISSRIWKNIALNMRHRSEESLKSRYKDYLVHITQYDLDSIFTYIEENGIQGFFNQQKFLGQLFFDKDEKGQRKFKKVITIASSEKRKEQEREKLKNSQHFIKEIQQRIDKRNESSKGDKKPDGGVTPSRAFLRVPESQNGNKRTHKEMVTVDEYEGDEHPSQEEVGPQKHAQNPRNSIINLGGGYPYQQMPPYNPYFMPFYPSQQFQGEVDEKDPYKKQYNNQGYLPYQTPMTKDMPYGQYPPYPYQMPPNPYMYPPYAQYPPYGFQNLQSRNQKRSTLKPDPYRQKYNVTQKPTTPEQKSQQVYKKQFQNKASLANKSGSPVKDAPSGQGQGGLNKLTEMQKNLIAKNFEIGQDDHFDEGELENILALFSEWNHVSKQYIVDALDRLSGDIDLLDQFLNTRDESLLWHEEDDLILSQIKTDTSPELKLFYRMKGEENVKKRIPYLGLTLPFKL